MKVKLTAIIALALTCAALMMSCLVVPPADDGDGKYSVISADSDIGMTVRGALYQAYNTMLDVYEDDEGVEGKLIYLGDTDSASTSYAKTKLAPRLSSSGYEDAAGYVICEHKGNIAVYWSDAILADEAIEAFIAEYTQGESLTVTEGYLSSEVYSVLAYKRGLEQIEQDEMFAALVKGLGQDTVTALQSLYDIYDERLYKWMANLYDPGTGGYYYSNSALENAGFLPDLESTYQALDFIRETGMVNNYGGNIKAVGKALPKDVRDRIVSFVHSLQSSVDGYYYHPQWATTVGESRSRDLNWGVMLLDLFEEMPLYDTVTGIKGSLGAPTGFVSAKGLTGRLEHSGVMAVSSVVATAYASIYDSEEAFKEYFDSLPWGTDSYGAGGSLSGRSREIRAQGYAEYCVELMNAEQEKIQQALIAEGKEPNGLWETENSYRAINGLMKISSTYTVLGGKINYAELLVEKAIEMLLHDGPDINGKTVENIVYVYNPWVALNYCIQNLETFGYETEMLACREIVRSRAVELINATARDAARFRRDDGSFSIQASGITIHNQYGLPHAIAGSIEGDVNGAVIASSRILREVCEGLYVREYIDKHTVPLYYESDLWEYIDILESNSAVVKPPIEPVYEFDFEEESRGAVNNDIMSLSSAKIVAGEFMITADPAGQRSGNVLRFTKTPSTVGGDNMEVRAPNSPSAYCYVLDFDMYVEEVIPAAGKTTAAILQVKIGTGYCLFVEWDNGKLKFSDVGSNSATRIALGVATTMNEWHNVRLEYYPSNDSAYVKIYLDGEYVTASNNYLGKADGEKPSLGYSSVTFFGLKAAEFTAYFDNISIEKNAADTDSGNEETPEFLPIREYDFEDEDFEAENGDILCLGSQRMRAGKLTVVDDPEGEYGQVMKYFTDVSTEGGDNVSFAAPVSENGYCYIVEWDMMVEEVISSKSSSTMLQIKLSDCYWFVMIWENGELCLADVDASDKTPERLLDSDGDAVTATMNEWHNYRIEYYPAEGRTAISLDGDEVAESVNFIVRTMTEEQMVQNGLLEEGERFDESTAAPSSEFSTFSLFALKNASFICYIDNIYMEKTSE